MCSSDCTTSLYLLNNGSPSRRKFLHSTHTHNSCVNNIKCALSVITDVTAASLLTSQSFAQNSSKIHKLQTGDLCRLARRHRRYRIVRKLCRRQFHDFIQIIDLAVTILQFHSKSSLYRLWENILQGENFANLAKMVKLLTLNQTANISRYAVHTAEERPLWVG